MGRSCEVFTQNWNGIENYVFYYLDASFSKFNNIKYKNNHNHNKNVSKLKGGFKSKY